MIFNFVLLDSYMVYNNSFELVLKVLGKDFPIKIFQTSKLIECQYNCIEYSHKNKFIDTNLKLAMKHFLIQVQVDYLNSICDKKSFTSHDLGFFSNMLVLRSLTSSPSIDLLNVSVNNYEKVKTTFLSDKMLCGALGNQYLSPITSFLFTEDWIKLSEVHKYQKILDYDKNFNLKLLADVNAFAEAAWEQKAFSDKYNNFENFLYYVKELLNQQYWIHNYGDYKLYKSSDNYLLYPEIYQILYNLDFKFNDLTGESKIFFDSLFFDKDLINNIDLSNYKNIEDFKDQLVSWRNKGEILEYKKSVLFLNLINEKYLIEDFVEKDLKESFELLFKNAKNEKIECFLFLLDNKNLNFQRIKTAIKSDEVFFYYYIPSFETISSKTLILIGFKFNELNNFNFFFKNFSYLKNHDEIILYLIKNINWKETDLYNHYLYWSSNESSLTVVSSYLDFLSGGLVMLLPKTWQN